MSYLEKFTDEELFKIFDSNIEEEIKSRGYEFGWHKQIRYAGDIYILVNPAFPNLVKIGYADNVQKRVKTLNSNSGLPDPYHVYATYKVKKRLEDLKLHKLIDSLDSDLRHAKNKEFYEMTPQKAYEILSAIAEINGDEDLLVFNPYQDEFIAGYSMTDSDNHGGESEHVPDGTYYMTRKVKRWGNKELKATVKVQAGNWILQPGSMVCPYCTDDANGKRAKALRTNVKIVDDVLQEEVTLSSSSTAGSFCVGASVNGWTNWFLPDGRPIDIYRENKQENS